MRTMHGVIYVYYVKGHKTMHGTGKLQETNIGDTTYVTVASNVSLSYKYYLDSAFHTRIIRKKMYVGSSGTAMA